jgi:CheY-like chemotaxis protein
MKDEPRVLIVDDEVEILDLLEEALDTLGIASARASNGAVALELLQNSPSIRVVVSDINMPLLDGLKLRERASTLTSERGLSWIALTTPGASTGEPDRLAAFDATFYKPYGFLKLARLISAQIGPAD